MTVLAILGAFFFIAIIVWSIDAIDEYSENKYDFRPFSIKNTALMLIPPVLLLLTHFFIKEGASWQDNLHDLNIIVLIILALISFLGIFIYIAKNSNFYIALYSSTLQVIGAVIIIAVSVILFFLFSGGGEKKRSK